MRYLIFLCLMAGLVAASGIAADLGGRAPSAGPAFGREGGETLETAVPIPSLPFVDSGTTCDNADDYDIP